MSEASVTRPSTVESFLKTTTGLRVGPKPVEVFLAQLDALINQIRAWLDVEERSR